MSLNCNEINLILNELNIAGTFMQEIVQPSYDSIAFYTYKPAQAKTVFVSLNSSSCRINETRKKITKNDKPLRFMELLRSKIKGARITSIEQINDNRIIKISLVKEGPIIVMPAAQEKFAKKKRHTPDPDADTTEEYYLYIRLWSNAANIFLTDKNNIILDSFYRRPAKNEMKGEVFIIPEPKQTDKQWPIRDFAELSAQYAKEHPDYPELSFNQKVDLWYSTNAAQSSIESLLEQAGKWYNEKHSKQKNALDKLIQKKNDFLHADSWKHQGDLILSYSYLIQKDSNFLECEDYDTGKTISIKIDPKLSAQQNAQVYYDTYKKQTSGLEDLEHDIAMSQKALIDLENLYQSMLKEQNPIKLEQVIRKTQKPRQQEKRTHPGLSYTIDGWYILVGRDADENDELLRHYVKGFDMWMHTRDYAGGYIFIKNRPGKTIPLDILLYAGNLAVYYSKARKNGSADLYYTQVKHLRRAKNGPKGLVLPTNEKNLHIELDNTKLRRLDEISKEQEGI